MPSEKDYLHDPKIRSKWSLSNAINSIRIAQPNAKLGFTIVDTNINHDICIWLSMCRSRCDLLIVGIPELAYLKDKQEWQRLAFTYASLSVVDYIVPIENYDDKEVQEINPHFWIIRKDTSIANKHNNSERIGQTLVQLLDYPPWRTNSSLITL